MPFNYPVLLGKYTLFGPQHEKTCLRGFTNDTGADQPVHPRSLISAFLIVSYVNLQQVIFQFSS